MAERHRHLDLASQIVILVTFILFVAALFAKGFGHELFLEAGVFLVSVKLIMMAYKNSVNARQLDERLAQMQTSLARVEALVADEGR